MSLLCPIAHIIIYPKQYYNHTRLLHYFCSLSSSDRAIGCHPAATPAATIPTITVGAPSALLDRDRVDRGLLPELGVAIGDPSKGLS